MPEPHDHVKILAQDWLPLVEAGRAQFHLLLKVEARGEGLARTSNHDDADRRVPFGEIHGAIDFLEHAAVQRVGARRTRQRQMGNGTRNAIGDGFKVQLLLARFPASPGSSVVPLQLTFIFGIWVSLLSLVCGSRLLFVPKFSAAALTASGATVLSTVPTQLRTLSADAHIDAPQLRTILTGGEPFGPALSERLAILLPDVNLFDLFGLTETGSCDFLREARGPACRTRHDRSFNGRRRVPHSRGAGAGPARRSRRTPDPHAVCHGGLPRA